MKIKTPIVSACIITYNQEDYIKQCIDGVLMQKTKFDFEIIIGDDSSTDLTSKICQEYAFKYPKLINYELNLENLGMIGNWVKTIKGCQGKYIALCEGDDYWTDPLKLQKQVDFLEANPDIVGCFHNSICVDKNSIIIEQQYLKKTDKKQYSQEDCLKVLRSSYSTASLVFRAKALKNQLELFSNIASDFMLDIFITNYGDLYYLDENMSAYRIHSGGIWQGNSELYNLKATLERYLFMYNQKTFKQRYNDYLWKSILITYDEIIRLIQSKKEKNKIKLKKYSFLNYSEHRTYLYLLKKNKLPFYYKVKKLTSKKRNN